ncbi:PepSY-associated TM helix domain-containing protein [Novosphingobium bradum]|uniref:PepSY-associated TM helix domain-containing protein n=1 Tax=Novosphingobium bradum TaxID=1737444 RepID=A0ABV7IQE5_9SPHN
MRGNLYRRLWRWHFYAGLAVIPFILVLSLTGAMFLFKPQLDRWEERAFRDLAPGVEVAPSLQRAAALAARPGAMLHSWRLPERPGDAAMAHLMLADGTMEDLFIAPSGQVLGAMAPEGRASAVIQRIHGQLLAGRFGAWLVEAAGSWAIVLVVTGLCLWWPRGTGSGKGLARWPGAGVVWPRLAAGRRVLWRDLHAVTGFWVSGLALVLLVTALPWTGLWGAGFKALREQAGWVKGAQDWPTGGQPPAGEGLHAAHDHHAMAGMHHPPAPPSTATAGDARVFDVVIARARSEHLAFPVLVVPPGPRAAHWTVRSEAQNRPLRATLTYDAVTARPINRETFAQKHPIDRVVGYGIAWHEGQLFGWANQLVGLVTALMIVVLALTGFVQWRRRKPADALGVPPPPAESLGKAALAVLILLGLVLPMLALSLLVLAAGEGLARRLSPRAARWLSG